MAGLGSGNYDLSSRQKEILLEKQKKCVDLRAEYQKQVTNPFRHATGEGGALVYYVYILLNLPLHFV